MIALYGASIGEVDQVLKELCVIHPYGMVGQLDWTDAKTKRSGIEFGGDFGSRLADLSSQIITFNEATDDGLVRQVREEIASATKLVFLGFAFHPQNVEMFATRGPSKEKDVYATTLGISDVGTEAIRKDLWAALGGINPPNNDPIGIRFYPEELDCAQDLRRHRRALTG